MLAKVNLHLILLMVPIALCSLLQYTDAIPFLTISDKVIYRNIIPWLFSIGCALVLPNRNRIWMICGSSISYYIIYTLLTKLHQNYTTPCILAAFVAPLISSIFAPKTVHKLRNYKSLILNYLLALLFLFLTSVFLSYGLFFLFQVIGKNFNSVFIKSVYDNNYSFIYSVIYQFANTFGCGDFIKEFRAIYPYDQTSISFYATTIAINFSVIPGIFLALSICQQKRKFLFLGFMVFALIGSTSEQAISYLLLMLLWLYPTIFCLFLIICFVFYFIGQYVDYTMLIEPSSFYMPYLEVSEINFIDVKFLLMCVITFITSVTVTTLFIVKDKIIAKNNLQPITTNDNNELKELIDFKDHSFIATKIIQFFGGFNNIVNLSYKDNYINITVQNSDLIKINELMKISTFQVSTMNNHEFSVSIFNNCQEIYNAINLLAQRVFLDINSNYDDFPHFNIEKTKFNSQIAKKE